MSWISKDMFLLTDCRYYAGILIRRAELEKQAMLCIGGIIHLKPAVRIDQDKVLNCTTTLFGKIKHRHHC
jgi:hypothetical protein